MAQCPEARQRVEASHTWAQSGLAVELAKIAEEPFVPVEARLVGWSLAVGALLLGLLTWVSYTFFVG